MALTDSLVSYWKLDESSGNASDSVGSNTLTNNGSATFTTGKINNATDLESGSSQYFSIADASQSGLDFSGDMSVSCWVKFESVPGSGNGMTIISKMTGAVANRSYLFEYDNGWHFGSNMLGAQTFDTSGTNSCRGYTSWTPSTGTWYHLVWTHSTASSGTHTFYINGVAQTTTYTVRTSGAIQNTSQAFRMGADDDGGIGRYFDGIIDEVGVWSRELTSSEVSSLYNSGNGLSYPFSSSQIKTFDGVAQASLKNILVATNAQTKTIDAVTNS